MALKRKGNGAPERRGLITALVVMSIMIFIGVYFIVKSSNVPLPERIAAQIQTPGLFAIPSFSSAKKETTATDKKLSHTDWTTQNHSKKGAIVGIPTFITGDYLRLQNKEFRLWGVNATTDYELCQANPHDWPCGTTSRQALVLYTQGGLIACYERGVNAQGEQLAQCFRGDIDLNGLVVESGLGYALRSETTNYHLKEGMAKSRSAGVWNKN